MYAATTKDEGNAADGRFSTACKDSTPEPQIFTLQDVLDEVGNIFACPSFLIYSLDFLD
jgi:hypothetical protein